MALFNIRRDLARLRGRSVPSLAFSWVLIPVYALMNRGFRAVLLYRVARWFAARGDWLEARFLTALNEELHAVAIHPRASFGPGLILAGGFGVVIGPGVRCGADCTLGVGSGIAAVGGRAPIVGDSVRLMPGAQVAGGCVIGNGVVVLPKAAVSFDVPNGAWAGSADARGIAE